MKNLIPFLLLFVFCNSKNYTVEDEIQVKNPFLNPDSIFENHLNHISDGFDFPVGKPDASGYYNAQIFGENNHLGDDWNGVGGGDTDLGDPIYSIANGYVSEVKNYQGGWGKVIRIIHCVEQNERFIFLESIYAHCDTIEVDKETFLYRGDKIGTIGNCSGMYKAHLHIELRNELNKDIGGGYSSEFEYHLNPSEYIINNRPKH